MQNLRNGSKGVMTNHGWYLQHVDPTLQFMCDFMHMPTELIRQLAIGVQVLLTILDATLCAVPAYSPVCHHEVISLHLTTLVRVG